MLFGIFCHARKQLDKNALKKESELYVRAQHHCLSQESWVKRKQNLISLQEFDTFSESST